jgi:hypothetical protein
MPLTARVQVVLSLLKLSLDAAGPDGMSPLSSPYERKDLPVAEKQGWTPVPPYIPRIQLQQLCSVAPTPPPSAADAAPWWKLSFWNRKSSSSSESALLATASLSSSTAKSESSRAAPTAEPVPAPLVAPLNQTAAGVASTVGAADAPDSASSAPRSTFGGWKRPKRENESKEQKEVYVEQHKEVHVQQHVSSRSSVLLAESMALKQAHDVLSWQVVFSGAHPPPSSLQRPHHRHVSWS